MMLLLLLLFWLVVVVVGGERITLQVQHLDELADLVARVSDPFHREYLSFPPLDSLHSRFAPSEDQIRGWLGNASYSLVDGRRWQIETNATVPPEARQYASEPRGRGGWRPWQSPMTPAYEVSSAETFAAVYNFSANATTSNGLRVAVVTEDGANVYTLADFVAFEGVMGRSALNITTYDASGTSAGVESSLDVDMVALMAPHNTTVQFIGNTNSYFGEFCTYLLTMPQPPHVVSLSWGEQEVFNYYGEEGEMEPCLMLLAAAGISLVVASGDNGVYGFNDDCAPSDGFEPTYPATSPYATAVGATLFSAEGATQFAGVPLCNQAHTVAQTAAAYDIGVGPFSQAGAIFTCATGADGAEVAVSKDSAGFFSGGGFSVQYAQPSWQESVVDAYLAQAVPFPPQSQWASGNRGFPDVAMYGAGGICVIGGSFASAAGTSQSAPMFAGAISHVIDYFLGRFGKGPGLLNPLLYALQAFNPATFNDIVSGTNNGTESNEPSSCPLGGFTTAPGWDAVTGLGTPNIGMMLYVLPLFLSQPNVSSSSTGVRMGGNSGSTGLLAATVGSSSSSLPPSNSSSSSSTILPVWAWAVIGVAGAVWAAVVLFIMTSSTSPGYTPLILH